MAKCIDMTGWVMAEHGVPDSRLTVVERAQDHVNASGRKTIMWKCKCSCGSSKEVITSASNLNSGNTLSCGCLNKELIQQRFHKTNQYNLLQEYGIGYSSNTNEEFYFSLDDYDLIKDYCWCKIKTGYLMAYDNQHKKNIFIHRLIMGAQDLFFVDHINHNKMDNRRDNLRLCTKQENANNSTLSVCNTSGVTGVFYDKNKNSWIAYIQSDKYTTKYVYHGQSKEEAIKARLQAEIKYYSEFAPQKHLFQQYGITLQNNYEVKI